MSQFGRKQNEAKKMELRRARFNTTPAKSSKDYGLASKGDTTLQSSEKKRIEYFDEIVNAYTSFQLQENENRVRNMNIDGKVTQNDQLGRSGGRFIADRQDPRPEVASTLRKLRILREALMSHRPNEFSKKVFMFSVRVGAKCRQFETYVASILYLINNATGLLDPEEKTEIVSLLILHVSHCNLDSNGAMNLFFQHLDIQKNIYLYRLLQAWVTDDYYYWMKAFKEENDIATLSIMSFGLERMSKIMIECINGAYFTYPLKGIENILPKEIKWQVFKRRFEIQWVEANGNLTIKTRNKPLKSA